MIRTPLAALLAASLLTLAGCGSHPATGAPALQARQAALQAQEARAIDQTLAQLEAVKHHQVKDWTVLKGIVSVVQPDDNQGLRHQKFQFKLADGKKIQVAHNIDLAPHVPVAVGDEVEVKCEYIRSKPMDVAHWTHYDPQGGEGGYIKHKGKIYDRNEQAQDQ